MSASSDFASLNVTQKIALVALVVVIYASLVTVMSWSLMLLFMAFGVSVPFVKVALVYGVAVLIGLGIKSLFKK